MGRELPEHVVWHEYPNRWRRTHRFIPRILRFSDCIDGSSRHFAGGTFNRAVPECPECEQRLTLVWDLDLTSSEFPEFVRESFAPAPRLPLLICWRCMAASYGLEGLNELVCFPLVPGTEILYEGESPHLDSPLELPRRPICFEAIPSQIDGLITLEESVGLEEFDQDTRSALNGYYGKVIDSPWDMSFSTFGGALAIFQGHRNKVCPNPRCPAAKLCHPYGELDTDYLMKEMAVIHIDAEPELKRAYFQLVYYVCCICFAIRAEYRCD